MKLLLPIILLLSQTATFAQKQSAKIDPWTAYMTPSLTHETLEKYTGEWDLEITMWLDDNQPPQRVTLRSSNRMVLGGRYLQLIQTGTMMGMNYEAISTLGFNNASQQVELSSITNMGTGMLYLTGPWQNMAQPVTLSGQLVNPVDGQSIKVKQVINFVDLNTILIENLDQLSAQKVRKSMQYKLTRKK